MNERDVAAQNIVEKHVWWAAGAGLVPIPFLDMAAITAIDMKMLRELSAAYEVEFLEDRCKALVASLTGGVGSGLLAYSSRIGTVIKAIPFIGQTIGALTMPIFGGAVTYAVGKVFIQHFATGGTMLDLEPEKVRHFFGEQYEKGKRLVTRKREPVPSPVPA